MNTYDVVGIGAGPANLSLAALLQSHTDRSIALFDKASSSRWHTSLLHPGVRMQTSWLKDLVSMVDPTHRLTFLNYLVTEGRLFALLNAQFDFIPRAEYMRYLAWATERIDNVHHDTPVDEVDFVDGQGFVTVSRGRAVATSTHLVLGVGTRSAMPQTFAALPDERVFVADHLGGRLPAMTSEPGSLDLPVAVVGGGQTGMEAVLRLRAAGFRNIHWLGRRQWFMTIDDSPAANEFYRPAHQQFLQSLTGPTRRRLVEEETPTGDALTPGALRTLYQLNYDGMLELGRFPITLLPGRDVVGATTDGADVVLTAVTPEKAEQHRARYVVVAVGREPAPVPLSDALRDRLDTDDDGEMVVQSDYSVRWKGTDGHRIYAMNRARLSHGIPDANLTLLPIRSALVINSIVERQLFTVRDELCPVRWG
jgi:lysine N6-hydroxylase